MKIRNNSLIAILVIFTIVDCKKTDLRCGYEDMQTYVLSSVDYYLGQNTMTYALESDVAGQITDTAAIVGDGSSLHARDLVKYNPTFKSVGIQTDDAAMVGVHTLVIRDC